MRKKAERKLLRAMGGCASIEERPSASSATPAHRFASTEAMYNFDGDENPAVSDNAEEEEAANASSDTGESYILSERNSLFVADLTSQGGGIDDRTVDGSALIATRAAQKQRPSLVASESLLPPPAMLSITAIDYGVRFDSDPPERSTTRCRESSVTHAPSDSHGRSFNSNMVSLTSVSPEIAVVDDHHPGAATIWGSQDPVERDIFLPLQLPKNSPEDDEQVSSALHSTHNVLDQC